MKKSFAQEEMQCESLFRLSGPLWHLYTPENHSVILANIEDFKAAVTLLAICAVAFPSVKVLTFQWMNNHLHIVLSGPEDDIAGLFKMLKRYLGNYLKYQERKGLLDSWDFCKRRINDLYDVRNAIAYVNRNGFLVHRNYSPFSYPWGANRCFFNPDCSARYSESKTVLRSQRIREFFHTRDLDGFSGLRMLDGYVCPFSFCDIVSAEGMFRNASQYFYSVSRNVESMKAIAKEIGESLYYNDDELFSIVCNISREKYSVSRPAFLPAAAKVQVAREMHFDYNAGNKQIARILKVDESLIDSFLL